ncbi:MAG: CBS domain-containing protein [Desulfobacula sp.]|jgi:CBS domain containing-hemolysin-like protein|uniref:CBS domain-containing protein n=1 Tax=Desulfobacula sp. TaxID=2593537 RepID=UPI001D690985|nr:CBS domain-containing protein [Desulfobacula sp.]MBT3485895.1 CBS domain-containing protein [Desulfobacula sp.]MBT3805460.1 CBS domain-containing protein [Desulfobacula sp.]MBT4025971.1 CBS domain-containing protein [Desulfobacula sp.]MBT4199110.1 CBS domain-containing protein [Desulfobacula sp.]
MKIQKVKELMIPLSEYATVNEDDTLEKAVKTLCDSQKALSIDAYKHRATLVYDKTGDITGKVSLFDVLRALEPKYSQFGNSDHLSKMGLSRFGLSNDFLHSLVENYNLWDESCESLVEKAKKRPVKEIMYSPQEGEYVDEDLSIPEAIHHFILGNHQSLLVLRQKKVVGILRLTDVFKLICDLMIKE